MQTGRHGDLEGEDVRDIWMDYGHFSDVCDRKEAEKMILRKEAEIRNRIRNYMIALNRDGQPEMYYKNIKVAMNELRWMLGESGTDA